MSGQVAMILTLGLPLLGALLAIVWGRYNRIIAGVAIVGTTLAGFMLTVAVFKLGVIILPIGLWDAPLGITLRADGLGLAFMVMSSVVLLAVAWQQMALTRPRDVTDRSDYLFWPLALLLLGALNAIYLSRDLFNLYVALELLTLSAVALVAMKGSADTLAAAMRYMFFALMGSLSVLLGAALSYAAHGTLDITLLGERGMDGPTDMLAITLITIGLLAKTALFPFHAWLPPAHSGAPAPASAMLSALVPKASFYILLRLWFEAAPLLAGEMILMLFGVLGALAIFYGSVMAMRQKRLKMLIAYSTVAQLGYLFLIFPLAGGAEAMQPWAAGAWTGGIFHAISHGLAKASMFLCAGLWIHAVGHDRMESMRGMVKAMPITIFAFALSAVSLIGLPPSGGFIAKYMMLTSAFASGQVALVVVIAVGGLLSAAYLYRPLALSFVDEPAAIESPVSRLAQIAPLMLAIMAVILGIASAWPFDFLQIGLPLSAVEGLE